MNRNEIAKDWSFVHVSDMHIGSPRSYRFQPAWNDNWQTARRQIVELHPDLLLVGGDMTRDGTTHVEELIAARDDFRDLPFPTHVIPGNHEVGNKYSPESEVAIQSSFVQQYRSVFGPSEWTFVHGAGRNSVRFTGCDAFLLGSGLPEEATLRSWLDEQKRLAPAVPGSEHHVWILHPALFADHPSEPDFDRETDRVAWYFALDGSERHCLWDVIKATGATHVITGHIHCRRVVDVEGVKVMFAPSTAFPQWGNRWSDGDDSLGFLHFTVRDGTVESRFVPLERESDRKGYGPGGNPPMAGRDYSISWDTPFRQTDTRDQSDPG